MNIPINNINTTPSNLESLTVCQNPVCSVGATSVSPVVYPSFCESTVASEPIPIIRNIAIIHQTIAVECSDLVISSVIVDSGTPSVW